ncbi:helicase [bacterium]|nr:helicase [bacterium]MBU1433582.1 helicase [bacterium]MBU1503237.1 helicase [bacterium]
MAKKNKKNIKINQKIRQYFDDEPFDMGVERVSTETLSELMHVLGMYDVEYSKHALLKAVRGVWSEGDTEVRAEILNFFANEGKVYKSTAPKEPNLDRTHKIQMLLDELDASAEEGALLFNAFMDVRSKKITIEKMEAKLKHIRYEMKKEKLQKALDGVFDIDDALEFNASIKYQIYDQTFHKILTLTTKPYEYEYLQNEAVETIIERIEKDKIAITEEKQKQTELFLAGIKKPHDYLTDKEIVASLRASPPKTATSYPYIKASILKSLIETKLDVLELALHDKEVLIKINESIRLPYSSIDFHYHLDLHLELDSLLETIWNSDELDFETVLHEAKKEHEEQFLQELKEIVDECGTYATLLHLAPEELHKKVYQFLVELLPKSLHISAKNARKIIRAFITDVHDLLIKKQRQALLARTIRDFKNLFPLARSMRRKLIFHVGPTNSGKTYQAMQKLEAADTGYYLAPLRLLALEGYETLRENGIACSLITGEEQLLDEDATHISSTIEMLNFEVDVDVCIIDEVQMIDDRDRGWAWANAIIGAPAKEIIMTGSTNAREAVIALAEYLGEELEIVEFERKVPLSLLDAPTPAEEVKSGSAIIAFSRKDVLKLKQEFSRYFSISVIYGNLSPEVRREEARRFREKETEILIATDAIAMGMNLPIDTILFSKAEKFDGVTIRDLQPPEVQQISGRAGRFGLSSAGYVGALSYDVLKVVKKNFNKEPKSITLPFKVMANLEHVKLVSTILEEKSLEEVLRFFVDNMEFNGPFRAQNLDDMLEAARILDGYDLDMAAKYHLACAPLTLKSPYIIATFESYVSYLEQKMPVPYAPPALVGSYAQTSEELLRAEDMVKEISLYLWLSYRFKEYFLEVPKVQKARHILNKFIENSLQQSRFVQRCRLCEVPLPLNSKYTICQACFKKNYTGQNARKRVYR